MRVKAKFKDFVGAFSKKPNVLYILEESTKSAFPLAFNSGKGKGWVVPEEMADCLSKCMIALLTDPKNPRMKIVSTAERDYQLRVQGYRLTTPDNWTVRHVAKACAKWFFLWGYWNTMKFLRFVQLKVAYRAEVACQAEKDMKKQIAAVRVQRQSKKKLSKRR